MVLDIDGNAEESHLQRHMHMPRLLSAGTGTFKTLSSKTVIDTFEPRRLITRVQTHKHTDTYLCWGGESGRLSGAQPVSDSCVDERHKASQRNSEI